MPEVREVREVRQHPALAVAAVALAVAIGVAIGLAPAQWGGVIALVAGVGAIALIGAAVRGPAPRRAPRARLAPRQVLALGSLYLVLASTLVFRQRTPDQLAEDPLDLAGTFRLTTLLGAFALACVSMLSLRLSLRRLPATAWVYAGYLVVVPLGALGAVSMGLVMFRWLELLTFFLVFFALTRAFDRATVPLRHLGIFFGAVVAAVVVGVVVFPSEAVIASPGALPFQLRGHLPQLSSNDVGALGLYVAAYGLGRTRISAGVVALGTALVLGAQYRTGYLALLAMVMVVLALRRHAAARLLLVGLALLLPLGIQTTFVEDAWVRGNEASLDTLTGRTVWWGVAIEATERSPVVGLGLGSGVRFEVLAERFNPLTSTIHSTWVEAYVGTGLVGVTVLAAALAVGLLTAWARGLRDGVLFPSAVMVMIAVKSVTGSTIDIGGLTAMLFLLAAWQAGERAAPVEPAPVAGRRRSPVGA